MQDEFRTVIDIEKFDFSIDPGSEVLLLGSCFSDNIGARFEQSHLRASVNPFGVVYNPYSIAKLLERALDLDLCGENELMQINGLWHHFDFHGSFSNVDKKTACSTINKAIEDTHEILKSTNFLILTFGSSLVYERVDTSEIVANCHKFPTDFFSRYRLDSDEIASKYRDLMVSLRMLNPKLTFIFTVSPVRHWKDGAHGNQLSKSVLFLAIDKLVEWFDGAVYFPAYEILMDELRDYRFYDPKMLQPSSQAVDYIWQRFSETVLSMRARKFIAVSSKISKARNHRLMNASRQDSVIFLENSLKLVEDVQNQFPEADLTSDLDYFRSLLSQSRFS
jgi:hypothetical protein